MTVIPVVGAKIQIGAGLHGRLFYRIIATKLYNQPDVQLTGFLADDGEWLDEDYVEIVSDPMVKFIDVARTWLVDNDYIYEG
jgi:hypothetical protein